MLSALHESDTQRATVTSPPLKCKFVLCTVKLTKFIFAILVVFSYPQCMCGDGSAPTTLEELMQRFRRHRKNVSGCFSSEQSVSARYRDCCPGTIREMNTANQHGVQQTNCVYLDYFTCTLHTWLPVCISNRQTDRETQTHTEATCRTVCLVIL